MATSLPLPFFLYQGLGKILVNVFA
jgi:hypothetical protein